MTRLCHQNDRLAPEKPSETKSRLGQYKWARWYDAENGRWISEDPVGFSAGDANLARYVGNGSTGATDPSGLEPPGPFENAYAQEALDWSNHPEILDYVVPIPEPTHPNNHLANPLIQMALELAETTDVTGYEVPVRTQAEIQAELDQHMAMLDAAENYRPPILGYYEQLLLSLYPEPAEEVAFAANFTFDVNVPKVNDETSVATPQQIASGINAALDEHFPFHVAFGPNPMPEMALAFNVNATIGGQVIVNPFITIPYLPDGFVVINADYEVTINASFAVSVPGIHSPVLSGYASPAFTIDLDLTPWVGLISLLVGGVPV